METKEVIKICFDALDSKKGEDIVILKVAEETVITDYFIIASGSNPSQVKAMADETEYKLSEAGVKILSKEGYGSSNWILIDTGDVIVHIFDRESRDFFKLEKLWSAAERITQDKTK